MYLEVNMEKQKTKQKIVSASISKEFHEMAMERGISWTEAMKIGLAIIFAERGIRDFVNELNVARITQIYESIKKNEQTVRG
jgi:hypothetical protein